MSSFIGKLGQKCLLNSIAESCKLHTIALPLLSSNVSDKMRREVKSLFRENGKYHFLSKKQKRAVCEAVLEGKNLLITGPGGSGKVRKSNKKT